jgi:acetyltransferase-like isoleucine patch superfamily enzyme
VNFDIIGNGNKIEIKSSCFLNSVTFYIRGDNHSICIGDSVRFNGVASIYFNDYNGSLEIGDMSTFENVHLAVTEPGSKMKIGLDCMFASDIDVRTGDSHSIIDIDSKERINYAKDVSIGNHVWVGEHCIILKGVCIPDESVLGTGSIVTKQFTQKGTIIAGNPARVVKEGITWSRERIYKTNYRHSDNDF